MSKEEAIQLLTVKQSELNRLPKKADFNPIYVPHIKRALGPWPRALEAAGLKPVPQKIIGRNNRRNNKEKIKIF